MTSVLIIDDQPVFRRYLRKLLIYAGFTIVGEAKDINTGLQITAKLKPDIAVIDLMLPGENGISGAKKIKDITGNIRVFLVSAHKDSADLFSHLAQETGAEAFIAKEDLDLGFVSKWLDK